MTHDVCVSVAEVAMWKSKYEAMADLYQTLKKENLELLRKHDDLERQLRNTTADSETLTKLQSQNKVRPREHVSLFRWLIRVAL